MLEKSALISMLLESRCFEIHAKEGEASNPCTENGLMELGLACPQEAPNLTRRDADGQPEEAWAVREDPRGGVRGGRSARREHADRGSAGRRCRWCGDAVLRKGAARRWWSKGRRRRGRSRRCRWRSEMGFGGEPVGSGQRAALRHGGGDVRAALGSSRGRSADGQKKRADGWGEASNANGDARRVTDGRIRVAWVDRAADRRGGLVARSGPWTSVVTGTSARRVGGGNGGLGFGGAWIMKEWCGRLVWGGFRGSWIAGVLGLDEGFFFWEDE